MKMLLTRTPESEGSTDTQNLFARTLGMYSKHKLDLIGFGSLSMTRATWITY